jgi:ATP-binding cassette, subfamily B, bacterial
VILDEPTAALDAKAEHELFGRIGGVVRGPFGAVDLAPVLDGASADRIYVLADGCVVESGTHEQLMAVGGTYAELFTLQASPYQ